MQQRLPSLAMPRLFWGFLLTILSLLCPCALEAQEQSTSSASMLSEEKRAQLYEHWMALAKIYEELGDHAMAETARNNAQRFAPAPSQENSSPEEEVASSQQQQEDTTLPKEENIDNESEKLPLAPPTLPSVDLLLTHHFQEYLAHWFRGNSQDIINLTAPILLLPLYSDGLIKEEQVAFFMEFFTTYPQFRQLVLEDIYQLESLQITQFDNSKAMLSIQSQPYPPEVLNEWQYWSNFWNNTHHYFFQKMADGKWYLLAFDMEAHAPHPFGF